MDLATPVSKLHLVGPVFARRLKKLDIETVGDLINHVPSRYLDFRLSSDIARVQIGEILTVRAQIISVKNVYTKNGKKMQMAQISDHTGEMKVVWFNQPYLVRNMYAGEKYCFSGKVGWFDRKKAFISPEFERIIENHNTVHTARLVPVYPETAGISSKWLRSRISRLFSETGAHFEEFLPESTLSELNLPEISDALISTHSPDNPEEAADGIKRLAFNELLFHQLQSLHRKKGWEKIKLVHPISVNSKMIQEFTETLPFRLTESQSRSVNEIVKDFGKEHPMNRLLEGDVGSGKTVVAAAAAFAVFVNGYQSIFMAPTQILAQQHYETLKKIFEKFKVRVSLITSAGVKKDLGKTDIYVGTHSLIHKKVDFDTVAFIVIDEQHRFGVEQRAHLVGKSSKGEIAPHVLTMTATPIPRTVALTLYSDLDLSTLDELPAGRKPITTWLVPPQKRESAYVWVKNQILTQKIQVFIICPLIEESEIETMKQVKAATAEYEKLKEIFTPLNVGLLHGRQNAKTKNETLDKFKRGDIDILVATPVIEVGIDVPNATIMIIETAERFGLAQLHQIRGRIGRGEKKSYCLLFTDVRSRKVMTRLEALRKTISGFELAELDLKLRGPGEVFGTKQHGFPELKIASWSDTELIRLSRRIAQEAIEAPDKYKKLFKVLTSKNVVPN